MNDTTHEVTLSSEEDDLQRTHDARSNTIPPHYRRTIRILRRLTDTGPHGRSANLVDRMLKREERVRSRYLETRQRASSAAKSTAPAKP